MVVVEGKILEICEIDMLFKFMRVSERVLPDRELFDHQGAVGFGLLARIINTPQPCKAGAKSLLPRLGMLKSLLLSLLFVSRRSAQPADVAPENVTDDSDAERARGQAFPEDIDIVDDNEELEGDILNDQDDPDQDPDPDAIADDVLNDQPPWSRRFQRNLSISHRRTITSLSAFIESRRRNTSLDFPPFSWFGKLLEYLRTSDPVSNDYLPHYRITPIFSGVIIPFSILLAIPGFTEHWYIKTHQNKTVETQKNPIVLDIGLAFSMLCAVLANVCLVVRFMEKRVRTMTLLCVIFLTIHGQLSLRTNEGG